MSRFTCLRRTPGSGAVWSAMIPSPICLERSRYDRCRLSPEPSPAPRSRLRLTIGAASVLATAPAFARGPDGIADVAEKVIDAVVNISTSQTVEAKGGGGGDRGATPQAAAGFAVRGILRRLLQEPPRRPGGKGGEEPRVPAAQDQFARLRLHRRHRRHRRDQQSRHRRCRRDQRHPQRRHQDQGRTGRRRQEDRPCGAEVQAAGSR